MLTKAKPFPLLPQALADSPLVQNIAFVLLVNWVFQGMRGMGKKELAGRLALEGLLVVLLAVLAGRVGLASPADWAVAILLAHTAQFLLNGQVWVCLRYWPGWRPDPSRNLRFLERTVALLRRQPWLAEAVCIGSCAAGAAPAGPRSDLDLRLIFPPGIAGFLRSHALLLRLRTAAFLQRVPLDLYALDDPAALERHRLDEPLGLVLDRDGRLLRRFAATRMLVEWP